MPTIRTDLGDTRESARRLRFEPVGLITDTDVQKAIERAATQVQPITSTAVTFGMSPYTVLPTDTVLYVDTAGGAITINLQAAASRNGVPLSIKDVTGHANANNITITPNGAETIDTLAMLPINADFGGYKLAPRAASYTIIP